MGNREILLKKIEEQEKNWETQIKDLLSEAQKFGENERREFEDQIGNLNKKLKVIESQITQIKDTSKPWTDLGDNIIHCWDEIVKNIDINISRLKK